jgi:hypothetical protein
MGIFDRNKGLPGRKPNLWLRYSIDEATRAKFGLSDREQREPAETGDRRVAAQMLAQRRREVRDGTWRPVSDSSAKLLVCHYAERWYQAQLKAGVVTAKLDWGRLENWVLPTLGDMPLDKVRRTDMKDLVVYLQEAISPRTKETLSPRQVHHIYAACRGMFRDALADELILATPCTLRIKKGELPKKRDKDPRWRALAIYTREEIETLISDKRIPLQRRVLYALTFFLYVRFGESAGRKWSDYDARTKPLGSMQVPTQYEDEETKTRVPRAVPVHPVLAKVLAEWKLEGFQRLIGRPPSADEFIVPKLDDWDGPQDGRRAWQNLQKDLVTLGLRPRRVHDLRRAAISLTLADGADKYMLKWVTHGPQKVDAFDLYNTPPWATLCAQVMKLDVGPRGAKVSRLPSRSRRTT